MCENVSNKKQSYITFVENVLQSRHCPKALYPAYKAQLSEKCAITISTLTEDMKIL